MGRWSEQDARWEVDFQEEATPKVTSWDYVREDINNREELGALKYNKYLTPSTSEDMLNHAYNEALDLVVYLRTLLLQRNNGYDPNL